MKRFLFRFVLFFFLKQESSLKKEWFQNGVWNDRKLFLPMRVDESWDWESWEIMIEGGKVGTHSIQI